jgi:hypothetical protein
MIVVTALTFGARLPGFVWLENISKAEWLLSGGLDHGAEWQLVADLGHVVR